MSDTHVSHVDLQAAAKKAMLENGFEPDFPPPVQQQLSDLAAHPPEVGPNANSGHEATLRTHLAIRARDYHQITVRIAQPNFSVLGCRVDVRLFNHFSP